MASHKCVIGLVHDYDVSYLVTLDGMKEHIRERIQRNKFVDEDPVYRQSTGLKVKVWSLSDYADKWKSTDLTRFDFCPECGKKIDWKAIKSGTEI